MGGCRRCQGHNLTTSLPQQQPKEECPCQEIPGQRLTLPSLKENQNRPTAPRAPLRTEAPKDGQRGQLRSSVLVRRSGKEFATRSSALGTVLVPGVLIGM